MLESTVGLLQRQGLEAIWLEACLVHDEVEILYVTCTRS